MVHDHHGVADNDFKLRAQRVYDAYHGLGGNGHGTQINNDIQNAPIAPPAGRKAIMSITINGVKPGTATLTIRAGPQSVDAPRHRAGAPVTVASDAGHDRRHLRGRPSERPPL